MQQKREKEHTGDERKRLVFCFDGTWNRLDAPDPTNVVITAQSLSPSGADGVSQFIYYDQGVGTTRGQHYLGGMFGMGVVRKLNDAYRNLIFNYTPGDEIYVFGFSRGAFTARSFVGLIASASILPRRNAGRITEAIELYKGRDTGPDYAHRMRCFRRDHAPDICLSDEEDAWRVANIEGYVSGQSPRLRIRYLGVWDTVGALGVPKRYVLLNWVNGGFKFHDTSLSGFVESARHAVAIDERRRDFAPTLWDNLAELNGATDKAADGVDALYQQRWFPGTHGSVGGGGDRRGLSDDALNWILEGARQQGLKLDNSESSRIYELQPSPTEFLQNVRDPDWKTRIMTAVRPTDRLPGPQSLSELSISTRRRWLQPAGQLPEGELYRPKTLDGVAEILEGLDPADYGIGEPAPGSRPGEFDLHIVQRNDGLQKLGKRYYGKPEFWRAILAANRDRIDDPDWIYFGQEIRIPKREFVMEEAPPNSLPGSAHS